ncbi:MAG: NAD(P)H-hydrate epimerase [archaeon]|nr:NAD(P)H-hydrate epimerase [Nanoarchaeota archaeon]
MITSQEMQKLEEYAADQGIFPLNLMENAGKQLYLTIKEEFAILGKHLVIFAGNGNNAGDAFVAAHHFCQELPVIIFFFGEEWKLKDEAKVSLDQIKDSVNVIQINEEKNLENFRFQKNLDYIFLDALLGLGIKGEIRDPISFAIDYFNKQNGKKVAVDLPSGIDPDTGEVKGKCCDVDLIVTFHDIKKGLAEKPELKEKTIVVDIGIPKGITLPKKDTPVREIKIS